MADPTDTAEFGQAQTRAASPRQQAAWLSRQRRRQVLGYIFGDNWLIGTASLMLLVISGFATWSGMSDFIVGASGTGTESVGQSIGGIAVTSNAVVVAIVIALTLLMWIALRETFGRERTFRERFVMMPLYAFLALWSVGFGYGFWWSLIAGQEATKTSMAALREDARDATGAIAARLEAVRIQLDSVVSWSESQMAREENSGGSCGIRSGRGRGPLYSARQSVRDQVASLRDNIATSWIDPVQRELEALQRTAAQTDAAGTVEERQIRFEGRASAIRSSARTIAARSNELGQSTAAEMRALAAVVSAKPGTSGFSCYDPTLAQRLAQAADQSGQPAELNLRQAVFNEGPAGVANAVKKLWGWVGGGIASVATAVTGGAFETAPAEFETAAFSGRDLIALLATVGIDFGLAALTIFNPPQKPVRGIPPEARTHIRRALQRARQTPGVNVDWIRIHFVHHKRKSYLVIPNLYSTDPNSDERARALAMNKLAGVLDDLRVVRWPEDRPFHFRRLGRSELEVLQDEERHETSRTSLADLRRERLKSGGAKIDPDIRQRLEDKVKYGPLRNHGLFSKAEAALEQAGWSEQAQADVEVFVLTDTEGLTPILEALDEMRLQPAGSQAAVQTPIGDITS
ncbi:MAG: hypothetical protein AAFR23_06005 [Pseudomonadota bacterium]